MASCISCDIPRSLKRLIKEVRTLLDAEFVSQLTESKFISPTIMLYLYFFDLFEQ